MSTIIFREKRRNRYFKYASKRELHNVAQAIVNERLNEGWYVDVEEGTPEWDQLQRAIHDGEKALSFLQSRKDAEYEDFEIVGVDS